MRVEKILSDSFLHFFVHTDAERKYAAKAAYGSHNPIYMPMPGYYGKAEIKTDE